MKNETATKGKYPSFHVNPELRFQSKKSKPEAKDHKFSYVQRPENSSSWLDVFKNEKITPNPQ